MRRWSFTEHDQRLPVWWTWRVSGAERSIAQVSEGFATLGTAVADAIRNGFRPRDDYSVLETTHAVVHFERAKHVVSASKSRVRKPSGRRVVPGKNPLSKLAAAAKSPRRRGAER